MADEAKDVGFPASSSFVTVSFMEFQFMAELILNSIILFPLIGKEKHKN